MARRDVTGAVADDGFEAWYRREHPRVVAALAAITGRPELAADAADEAFARACARWRRVGRTASPAGWVHTTALRVARRRVARPAPAGRRGARITISAGGDAPATEAPPAGWPPELWTALVALPPREQQVVAWHDVAGLRVPEVAAAMRLSVGAATSALDAGRRRLAAALAPSPFAPDGTPEEGVDA